MPPLIDCDLSRLPPPWEGPGGPAPLAAPAPPPPAGKGLYGGRLDHHVDSANFTVAWQGADATEDQARRASEALEAAWAALVEAQGWPQPTSSDRYLLWVILDPALSGTGLTVESFSADYPTGYPVIYLHPDMAAWPTFWESLAAHELVHALQFGMRGDWVGGADAWYWEASAEWGAELALPDNGSYAESSKYYAMAPELRFDSQEDAHAYGMFLLNASLEARRGPGAMREVWALSGDRVGEPWDTILAEATGEDAAALWAAFTADYGGEGLAESALYRPPAEEAWADEALEGTLPRLGTHYRTAPVDRYARVAAGDVVLAGSQGWSSGEGAQLYVPAGGRLAITGLAEPSTGYTVLLSETPWALDTGGADSGGAGDAPGDKQGRLACASAAAPTGWLSLAATTLVVCWRRRAGR